MQTVNGRDEKLWHFSGLGMVSLGQICEGATEPAVSSFLAEVSCGFLAGVQPQWQWSIQVHHLKRNCSGHLGTSGQPAYCFPRLDSLESQWQSSVCSIMQAGCSHHFPFELLSLKTGCSSAIRHDPKPVGP